jgi:hypothetical protein
MNAFNIVFDPPLPEASELRDDLSLSDIDYEKVLQDIPEFYNIQYIINEETFGYRPASIMTVLNDIHLEWSLCRARKSHDMTLSGYPILKAVFDGDEVRFHDLKKLIKLKEERSLIGIFEAEFIERAFGFSLESILLLIKTKLGAG